jgi:hypothetical protein
MSNSALEAEIRLKLIFGDAFGVQGVKIYDRSSTICFLPGLGPFKIRAWMADWRQGYDYDYDCDKDCGKAFQQRLWESFPTSFVGTPA